MLKICCRDSRLISRRTPGAHLLNSMVAVSVDCLMEDGGYAMPLPLAFDGYRVDATMTCTPFAGIRQVCKSYAAILRLCRAKDKAAPHALSPLMATGYCHAAGGVMRDAAIAAPNKRSWEAGHALVAAIASRPASPRDAPHLFYGWFDVIFFSMARL